jgi:GntR family transcriptional regulator
MIEIDPKNRRSICEQVVDRLRVMIAAGLIAPDEKLPSVRELSKQLTVNPNTVQKAFSELERQGYVYTTVGVGSFASNPKDIIPDERLIAASRIKLSDDIREIRSLTGSAEKTKGIVLDILTHVEGSFGRTPDKA